MAPHNPMSAKRIKKEIADLSRENLGSITLVPNESNIYLWKATLPGPAGSPYEGGTFEVDIRIPEDYPFSPPHLQFTTKLYHCNVASTGAICLDLLKHAWSPALSLYKVILSLSSLLTDPNPADPLVPAIAQEYKRDRKKHDATAREWVKKYAMPKPSAQVAAPAPVPTPKTITSTTTTSRAHARARPPPPSASVSASASASGPSSSSTSSTNGNGPTTRIAGRRRTAATAIIDDDEDETEGDVSVEVIDSVGRNVARPSTNGRAAKRTRGNDSTHTHSGGNASASVSGLGTGTRGGTGTSAGDAIVIDE